MDLEVKKFFEEADSQSSGGPTIKLLIAEDNEIVREIYKDAISDSKFEKRFAFDGFEAKKMFIEWKPEIVLLDIEMPVMSGLETLKSIREYEKHKSNKTTVIMATSNVDKDIIVKCAQEGIQGYIVKSDDLEGLDELILAPHIKYKEQLKSEE